ncbi:adenylyl-sulfate kinase [Flammeovirga yaeyamensis]|uniref:Adenylyl-sulfate kinase n=2 Tax=Flammeovirga yaeyamensis TaxID=367791 RepID=A0AAX1NCR6_9BACT|nr:adenylyl-sulfate kinase [Flammeovirga yaeyamensis]MBB3698064.1 adenylylsulfate kinase [Flammeovirga yaeyamensis]QWG03458.1 adenylyl-sulfate kinase [Flammeovirga yaeyamensis]
MSEATNIHPIFNSLLSREKKEGLLKQNGVVLWMTGLSGSGKSTLARALEFALHDLGYKTMLLDGDNLRTGVNSNLGFSEEDRMENVRRSAEVSKLFASAGLVTICSLISPTEEIRAIARDIIGEEDFKQVHIDCPFEVCAERDVKGLYKKALAGEIKNFTGLDSPFDIPKDPFVRIPTHEQSLEDSLKQLLEAVLPIIKLDENK